jgi:hypothetical protein
MTLTNIIVHEAFTISACNYSSLITVLGICFMAAEHGTRELERHFSLSGWMTSGADIRRSRRKQSDKR